MKSKVASGKPSLVTFETVLVSSVSEGIKCPFRREHCLIVICIEVASDHNAFITPCQNGNYDLLLLENFSRED
jgi:hypothetical protein